MWLVLSQFFSFFWGGGGVQCIPTGATFVVGWHLLASTCSSVPVGSLDPHCASGFHRSNPFVFVGKTVPTPFLLGSLGNWETAGGSKAKSSIRLQPTLHLHPVLLALPLFSFFSVPQTEGGGGGRLPNPTAPEHPHLPPPRRRRTG